MQAPMQAFVRTSKGIYKAYLDIDGRDWLVICPDGSERWFSVWRYNRRGSILRALSVASEAPESAVELCGADWLQLLDNGVAI